MARTHSKNLLWYFQMQLIEDSRRHHNFFWLIWSSSRARPCCADTIHGLPKCRVRIAIKEGAMLDKKGFIYRQVCAVAMMPYIGSRGLTMFFACSRDMITTYLLDIRNILGIWLHESYLPMSTPHVDNRGASFMTFNPKRTIRRFVEEEEIE